MRRVFFLFFSLFLGLRAENDNIWRNEPFAESKSVVSETFDSPGLTTLWQPAVGGKWQIILNSTIKLDPSGGIEPINVKIFEVDLFDTPKTTIQVLRNEGVKVICYFSGGTSEDWRPDFASFRNEDKGSCLPRWVGERYVDIRKQGVWEVMKARIRLAAEKGCDAIDPDNLGALLPLSSKIFQKKNRTCS